MDDLKNKVEAILFTVGKKIDIEEIAKLCRTNLEDVKNALEQLKKEYDEKDTSLIIFEEGTKWSLTAREKYVALTKRIVADTELSKTMLETLAVIAWKQPIKQSEVIAIRTNKAYDHVHELKDMGFVSSEKSGRTRLLKLTDKFFKYFEVSGEKDIRELFDKKIKESVEEGKEEIKEEIMEKEKELNEENKEIQEENKEEIEEQKPETVEGENKE